MRCGRFELRPDRIELFVRTPQGAALARAALRGRFNVENVLCAVTLALLLDVPLGAIERAVAVTGAPPGRFEPVEAGQAFGVIVDYAHTPGRHRCRAARARVRSRAGACCACSAPAAIATTPSGRSWAPRPRPGPTGST